MGPLGGDALLTLDMSVWSPEKRSGLDVPNGSCQARFYLSNKQLSNIRNL